MEDADIAKAQVVSLKEKSMRVTIRRHFIYILEIDGKKVEDSHLFSDIARVLEEEVKKRSINGTKGFKPMVLNATIKHEIELGPCALFHTPRR